MNIHAIAEEILAVLQDDPGRNQIDAQEILDRLRQRGHRPDPNKLERALLALERAGCLFASYTTTIHLKKEVYLTVYDIKPLCLGPYAW